MKIFRYMVLRIGHRGARGYKPENTLLSFKKAPLPFSAKNNSFVYGACTTAKTASLFLTKPIDTLKKGCFIE